MPGKHSRNKGARFEREVVSILRMAGYEAERIPLSGAMGTFKGDVQTIIGRLLKLECKVLGNGFKFLYTKLGNNDALVLKSDRQDPLIVFRLDKVLELLNDLHHSGNRDLTQRISGISEEND